MGIPVVWATFHNWWFQGPVPHRAESLASRISQTVCSAWLADIILLLWSVSARLLAGMCILCAVHLAYLSASALRWLLGSENSLCWLTYLALDWIVRALWNPVQGEEVYKLDLGKGFLLAFLWRIFRVGLTCGKARADSLSFSLLRSILHYLFVKWTWFSRTLRCTKRMIDCCRRLVNLVRIHQAEERGLLFLSSHLSFPSPPPSLSVSLSLSLSLKMWC